MKKEEKEQEMNLKKINSFSYIDHKLLIFYRNSAMMKIY